MKIRIAISVFLATLASPGPAPAQELYDVVIFGGRVMDPETGRDEVYVQQGDLSIRCSVLEAFYPKDGNQPDRLVARTEDR